MLRLLDRQFTIFIDQQRLQARVRELAEEISHTHSGLNPLFIAVLNGSFIFAADLMRSLDFPCNISFVKMASYSGTQSSGRVESLLGFPENIGGRHCILLEDIIDTGLTVETLQTGLRKRAPASLRTATLLFKKACVQTAIVPDFTGFEVPDRFLVGYGLDYNGYGRNLPHIYAEAGEEASA